MQKNIIFVLLFILALTLFPTSKTKAHPSNYSTWQYFQTINLNASTLAPDYQVKITLTTGNFDYSKSKSDGSDIRFADLNDNIINYFIETWNSTGDSVIWIKAPQSGTNAVNIYYGNNTAISESNGNNVFDFYDDFSGTSLDNSKWTSTISGVGTITVTDGLVDIYQPQEQDKWTEMHSNSTYGPNVILEGRASINYDGMYVYGTFGWHDQVYPSNYQLLFNDGSSFNNNVRYAAMKNSNLTELYNSGDINVFHEYKIIWSEIDSQMYFDGIQNFQVTNTDYIPNIPLVVTFYNHTPAAGIGFPNSTENQYLDWVRVRKYNSTTGEISSSSFGGEEAVNSTTVTASIPSFLSLTVNGTTSGVGCPNSGGNASVTTTPSLINFGTYYGAQTKIACQNLIVSTNATDGYIATLEQNHDLASAGDTISKFSAIYSSPTIWSSPSAGANSYFGFTTSDPDYVNFQIAKYAGISNNHTGYAIARSNGPVVSETNTISYQLEVDNFQASGTYTNNIMYIATGMF